MIRLSRVSVERWFDLTPHTIYFVQGASIIMEFIIHRCQRIWKLRNCSGSTKINICLLIELGWIRFYHWMDVNEFTPNFILKLSKFWVWALWRIVRSYEKWSVNASFVFIDWFPMSILFLWSYVWERQMVWKLFVLSLNLTKEKRLEQWNLILFCYLNWKLKIEH